MKKAIGLLCVMVCFGCLAGAYAQYTSQGTANMDVPNIEEKRIRSIHQDRRGHLWFGTHGVFRYDGDSFEYFPLTGAYGGAVVMGIAEDEQGNVWFALDGGVTKFDGESFTNFTEEDGLPSNDVWSIAVDSRGTIWIGTLEGVCYFDGNTFTRLPIPAATDRDYNKGVWSPTRVVCITEDSAGNMWFPVEGFGVYRYNGKSFTNFHSKDGLASDVIHSIFEDKDGTLWVGGYLGLFRFDGESFVCVTNKGPW